MNAEVSYWKARPNKHSWTDWYARIYLTALKYKDCVDEEGKPVSELVRSTFRIGPASFETVRANVANLLRGMVMAENLRFKKMEEEEAGEE